MKLLLIVPFLAAGSVYASQLTREIKNTSVSVTSSESCADSKDVATVQSDIVEYVPVEKGKKTRLAFRVAQTKDVTVKGKTVCEYACDKGTEPYIVSLKSEGGVKSLVACVIVQQGH